MLLPKARTPLPPSLLRGSDLRGKEGDVVTPETARLVGRAFGTVLRNRGEDSVCTAYDGRLSSPVLSDALTEGLLSCGLRVLRSRCSPTPLLYFTMKITGVPNGVMVTGSHNPKGYNGFKLTAGGLPFCGDDLAELADTALKGKFAEGTGRAEDVDLTEPYIHRLLRDFREGFDATIVWDCGNGAAGKIVPELVASLPGRHIVVNAEVDGTFPNHHPDPADAENMKQLQNLVLLENADAGFAFDGDGDRLGAVDSSGRVLSGDALLCVFAEQVLRFNPRALIVADVKSGKNFSDDIRSLGGVPLIWKTGHSFIKKKMKETGALLGGEMSGHYFFADKYYGYDDAFYAAIRLLDVISNGYEANLAERAEKYAQTFRLPEMKFDCPDNRRDAVMKEIRENVKKKGLETDETDGVGIRYPDGSRLLIRASNTMPQIVALCEADTPEGLEDARKNLLALLPEDIKVEKQ